MHGALPPDNIFLLALLLCSLSPCHGKKSHGESIVRQFFSDVHHSIKSVLASKIALTIRLLQQDFTKYFRAVMARWTQDLAVRTGGERIDSIDNFSDNQILAKARRIANWRKSQKPKPRNDPLKKLIDTKTQIIGILAPMAAYKELPRSNASAEISLENTLTNASDANALKSNAEDITVPPLDSDTSDEFLSPDDDGPVNEELIDDEESGNIPDIDAVINGLENSVEADLDNGDPNTEELDDEELESEFPSNDVENDLRSAVDEEISSTAEETEGEPSAELDDAIDAEKSLKAEDTGGEPSADLDKGDDYDDDDEKKENLILDDQIDSEIFMNLSSQLGLGAINGVSRDNILIKSLGWRDQVDSAITNLTSQLVGMNNTVLSQDHLITKTLDIKAQVDSGIMNLTRLLGRNATEEITREDLIAKSFHLRDQVNSGITNLTLLLVRHNISNEVPREVLIARFLELRDDVDSGITNLTRQIVGVLEPQVVSPDNHTVPEPQVVSPDNHTVPEPQVVSPDNHTVLEPQVVSPDNHTDTQNNSELNSTVANIGVEVNATSSDKLFENSTTSTLYISTEGNETPDIKIDESSDVPPGSLTDIEEQTELNDNAPDVGTEVNDISSEGPFVTGFTLTDMNATAGLNLDVSSTVNPESVTDTLNQSELNSTVTNIELELNDTSSERNFDTGTTLGSFTSMDTNATGGFNTDEPYVVNPASVTDPDQSELNDTPIETSSDRLFLGGFTLADMNATTGINIDEPFTLHPANLTDTVHQFELNDNVTGVNETTSERHFVMVTTTASPTLTNIDAKTAININEPHTVNPVSYTDAPNESELNDTVTDIGTEVYDNSSETTGVTLGSFTLTNMNSTTGFNIDEPYTVNPDNFTDTPNQLEMNDTFTNIGMDVNDTSSEGLLVTGTTSGSLIGMDVNDTSSQRLIVTGNTSGPLIGMDVNDTSSERLLVTGTTSGSLIGMDVNDTSSQRLIVTGNTSGPLIGMDVNDTSSERLLVTAITSGPLTSTDMNTTTGIDISGTVGIAATSTTADLRISTTLNSNVPLTTASILSFAGSTASSVSGHNPASQSSSTSTISPRFSITAIEGNSSANSRNVLSSINFDSKSTQMPRIENTLSRSKSKVNGTERKGFSHLMIFDAADPALDEDMPASSPFIKKDIIIQHTANLDSKPAPLQLTQEEKERFRVKTPSQSESFKSVKHQIDVPSDLRAHINQHLSSKRNSARKKRDISDSVAETIDCEDHDGSINRKKRKFLPIKSTKSFDSVPGRGRPNVPSYFQQYFDHRLSYSPQNAEPIKFEKADAFESRSIPSEKRKVDRLEKGLPKNKESTGGDNDASILVNFKVSVNPTFSSSVSSQTRVSLTTFSPNVPEPFQFLFRKVMKIDSLSHLTYEVGNISNVKIQPNATPLPTVPSRFDEEMWPNHETAESEEVAPPKENFDKPMSALYHRTVEERRRDKRAAFDALMSMIATRWAKANNDEANNDETEEPLHTDRVELKHDMEEGFALSEQFTKFRSHDVERPFLDLLKPQPHYMDPEPQLRVKDSSPTVKQFPNVRLFDVEHSLLDLLKQQPQDAPGLNPFNLIAHELHSKVSELCASFHAAWLHTHTATTARRGSTPTPFGKGRSVLMTTDNGKPTELLDPKNQRSFLDAGYVSKAFNRVLNGLKGQFQKSSVTPDSSLQGSEKDKYFSLGAAQFEQRDESPTPKLNRAEGKTDDSTLISVVTGNSIVPSNLAGALESNTSPYVESKVGTHPFLNLLKQQPQDSPSSSNFDLMAHELHSKISELCASFHALWLHTLTATTARERTTPAPIGKGKSMLMNIDKGKPIEVHKSEKALRAATGGSVAQRLENVRIARAYPDYPPLSVDDGTDSSIPVRMAKRESSTSKFIFPIPPTRKHIMRLDRKPGPVFSGPLEASSSTMPESLLKSVENFKKLARLDLEQLENIDLEDGFAIDEIDPDALVGPSSPEPADDIVEIHALPSPTKGKSVTRMREKSTQRTGAMPKIHIPSVPSLNNLLAWQNAFHRGVYSTSESSAVMYEGSLTKPNYRNSNVFKHVFSRQNDVTPFDPSNARSGTVLEKSHHVVPRPPYNALSPTRPTPPHSAYKEMVTFDYAILHTHGPEKPAQMSLGVKETSISKPNPTNQGSNETGEVKTNERVTIYPNLNILIASTNETTEIAQKTPVIQISHSIPVKYESPVNISFASGQSNILNQSIESAATTEAFPSDPIDRRVYQEADTPEQVSPPPIHNQEMPRFPSVPKYSQETPPSEQEFATIIDAGRINLGPEEASVSERQFFPRPIDDPGEAQIPLPPKFYQEVPPSEEVAITTADIVKSNHGSEETPISLRPFSLPPLDNQGEPQFPLPPEYHPEPPTSEQESAITSDTDKNNQGSKEAAVSERQFFLPPEDNQEVAQIPLPPKYNQEGPNSEEEAVTTANIHESNHGSPETPSSQRQFSLPPLGNLGDSQFPLPPKYNHESRPSEQESAITADTEKNNQGVPETAVNERQFSAAPNENQREAPCVLPPKYNQEPPPDEQEFATITDTDKHNEGLPEAPVNERQVSVASKYNQGALQFPLPPFYEQEPSPVQESATAADTDENSQGSPEALVNERQFSVPSKDEPDKPQFPMSPQKPQNLLPPNYDSKAPESSNSETPPPLLVKLINYLGNASPIRSHSPNLSKKRKEMSASRLSWSDKPTKPASTNGTSELLRELINIASQPFNTKFTLAPFGSSEPLEKNSARELVESKHFNRPEFPHSAVRVLSTPPAPLENVPVTSTVASKTVFTVKTTNETSVRALSSAGDSPLISTSSMSPSTSGSKVAQGTKLNLKKYYQRHPADKIKFAVVTRRMFYTRNPPTWTGTDRSIIYPPIVGTVQSVTPRKTTQTARILTTTENPKIEALVIDRKYYWQPFLVKDIISDALRQPHRTRFYNRSNRPQSRLYVKENTLLRKVHTHPPSASSSPEAVSSAE